MIYSQQKKYKIINRDWIEYNKMVNISKSRFLSGYQCEKKLFFDAYRKDLKPPITEAKQAVFDTGHIVGALAQQVYP